MSRTSRKLTKEDKEEICRMRKNGITPTEITEIFKISTRTLYEIFRMNGIYTRKKQLSHTISWDDSVNYVFAEKPDVTEKKVVLFGKKYIDITSKFMYEIEQSNSSDGFVYNCPLQSF